MGLLDCLTEEDDPVANEGIYHEFGNMMYYLGIVRSASKENIKGTLLFYFCIMFNLALFVSSFLYTGILALPLLSEVISMVHITLLVLLALIASYALFTKKTLIDKLYRNFYLHLIRFSYTYDPVIISFHLKREMYLKWAIKAVLFIITTGGMILILLDPLLNLWFDEEVVKISGVLYGIPIPIFWPLNYESYFFGFLLPSVLQTLCCFTVVGITSGTVCLYMSACLHIYFELKVLLHNIRSIDQHVARLILEDKRKIESSSSEELGYYNNFITDIVQHHIILINCIDLVNEIGKWMLLSIFLSGGVDIAMAAIMLLFVEARIGSTVTAVYFTFMEVVIFGIITFTSDILTEMGLEIQTEIYMIQWYLMREEVKKSLMIIMTCSQRPLCIRAGNLIPVDREMFSSILQTAYSFINLIAAVKSE